MSEAARQPKKIMIVVGEASGDLHGAQLVRALYQRDADLEIFGVAGEGLKREGIKVRFDVAQLTGMGFTELAGNLGSLWRAYRELRRALQEERPDLLILIDFPEFNLRLAHLAKALGVPVLYYVSPQVWAWRQQRIRKIARWVDQMAVVFPFEVPLYEKAGVKVCFVGHPLLDVARATEPPETTLARCGLTASKPTIALLPGSRRREIAFHLPVLLEAAERLSREMEVQFVLIRASTVDRGYFDGMVARTSLSVPISLGNTYNILNACALAWTASGTATLETALMLKPMVIIYRLSWLTYALARLLVRVRNIGMVNIIAGETVVPELIQGAVTPERILKESQMLLRDSGLYGRVVEKLKSVRERLGTPGAAGRVAEIALSMMH